MSVENTGGVVRGGGQGFPLLRIEVGRPNKHREVEMIVHVLQYEDASGASYREHSVGLVSLYPRKGRPAPRRSSS